MNYGMAGEGQAYAAQLMEAQEKLAAVEYRVDLKKNLEQQLYKARKEQERIEELLDLLNKNPDIQRILELLGHRF